MDIILTGIPAFIVAVVAALIIALRSFKKMMDERQTLERRLQKVQAELDALKEGMPEKEVRVNRLKKTHAAQKTKSTKLMRYYSALRKVEVEAEKEEVGEAEEPEGKDIQLRKRE